MGRFRAGGGPAGGWGLPARRDVVLDQHGNPLQRPRICPPLLSTVAGASLGQRFRGRPLWLWAVPGRGLVRARRYLMGERHHRAAWTGRALGCHTADETPSETQQAP